MRKSLRITPSFLHQNKELLQDVQKPKFCLENILGGLKVSYDNLAWRSSTKIHKTFMPHSTHLPAAINSNDNGVVVMLVHANQIVNWQPFLYTNMEVMM